MDQHIEKWDIYDKDGKIITKSENLPLTRAVCKGEIVKDEEWILRKADGSHIPVLCNAGPILDKAGKIMGGVIAWRDITERKKTEELLKENQNLLKAELDAMVVLHELGSISPEKDNLETILYKIIDAAIEITGADFGNIQLLDPTTSDLKIVAQRGFQKWWLDF